jgi:phage head maturation protease
MSVYPNLTPADLQAVFDNPDMAERRAEMRAERRRARVQGSAYRKPFAVIRKETQSSARITGAIEKFLSGNGLSPDQFAANLITGSLDLENDTTLASGCTPPSGCVPLLWGHDPQKVVGKAEYKTVGSTVKIVCTLIPRGISPEGDLARELAKGDYGMGVSAGFQPLETQPQKTGRGKVYTKFRLLEASLVAIPADQHARITARSHADDGRRARIEKAEAIGKRIRTDDAAAMGRRIRTDDALALAPPTTKAERLAKLAIATERGRRNGSLPPARIEVGHGGPQGEAQRALQHAKSVMALGRKWS